MLLKFKFKLVCLFFFCTTFFSLKAQELIFSNPSDAIINSCSTDVIVPSPEITNNTAINNFALDFDGVDDMVTVNQTIGSFKTIEFWMYTETGINGSEEFDYVFSFNDDSLKYIGTGNFTSNYTNETISMVTNYGQIMTTFQDIPAGWNHIAFTGNGSSFDKILINGVSVPVVNNGFPQVFTASSTDMGHSPTTTAGRFNGKLDEVRFWDTPRTVQQIADNYNSIIDASNSDLLAYYDFEDGPGSFTLTDRTSTGANGTLNNMDVTSDWVASEAPTESVTLINDFNGTQDASGTYPFGQTIVTWTATDAIGNQTTLAQTINVGDTEATEITCGADISVNSDPGECSTNVTVPQPEVSDNCTNNLALDFDGTDDYVDLNGSISLPNTFTIEAWVYSTSNSGEQSILAECDDPNSPSGCFGLDYDGLFFRSIDGKVDLSMFDNSGGFNGFVYTSNTALPLNSWTHVAATVNSITKTVSIYYNGILQPGGLIFNNGTGVPSSSYEPSIGGQNNVFNEVTTNLWSGKLDEIRIWDSQLSQADIQNRFENPLSGNESGLLAYYDFEDGAGSTTLTDRTASTVDGTLTNMDANTDWVQGPDALSGVTLLNDFNGTSDASGIYPVGQTEVVWTATDALGNSNTCNQIITVTGDASCGITYTYNDGTWLPNDPNGVAIAIDNIIVSSGDATLITDLTVDSVAINPGAGLTVSPGITLTTINGLVLESDSTSYSSLILDGTVVGTMTYERHVNINGSGTTGSNDLVSAPLTGQVFSDLASANPNIFNNGTLYLFGPFEKTSGQYINWAGTETATLEAGRGYRAATSDNGTVIFSGTAENGTITNNIENSGPIRQEWNLVGNPYPSYLNVQNFLNHDIGGVTNIQLFNAPTAAIYGYDGSAQNGWTIYNLANTTTSTLIAPGQGFFVSADATNTGPYDLEFTSTMRSTGASDDFIQGRNTELIYIKLTLNSGNESVGTDFYFNANATQGLDVGYDAEVFENTNLYSHLLEDNEGKAIALQALNPSELSDVSIPLGVHANQGEQITFSISETTLPESVHVYLDDVVANTSTLLNTNDYVITPSTNLSGTGRFFLRTSEEALSTIENNMETLNIFALNNSKEIVVSGSLKETTNLILYDIQGRQVLSIKLDHSKLNNPVDVSSVSDGVYVVSVGNNKLQKTQKVVIK